jgi:hypothetical protein
MGTENFLFPNFPKLKKLKGHNSAKNHQTMTKLKFDLHISLTYPYVKFELNVLYPRGDNERKLKISYYFQSERDITLAKKSRNHD